MCKRTTILSFLAAALFPGLLAAQYELHSCLGRVGRQLVRKRC